MMLKAWRQRRREQACWRGHHRTYLQRVELDLGDNEPLDLQRPVGGLYVLECDCGAHVKRYPCTITKDTAYSPVAAPQATRPELSPFTDDAILESECITRETFK